MATGAPKKVLLMGKHGSGKTSMRSIIFAEYPARSTGRLGPTIDVEYAMVRFVGDLVLNLWDCGGQDNFMDSYLKTQREHIFKHVGALIYVFDSQSDELEDDMLKFQECIQAVAEYSDTCKVFCLIHKMDTIQLEEDREARFNEFKELIEETCSKHEMVERGGTLTCFRTSIWDETLYAAWSTIVYSLIPNIDLLEQQLKSFAEICEADEVVLFEKKSFLVIVQHTIRQHKDIHRFEKISNFIKQFKLSCKQSTTKFARLELRNSHFTAFVESFTSTTYMMVIMSDPEIQPAATWINIHAGRQHFEANNLACGTQF
eukprot:TRINITY_DN23148_c0_g1_i16.p1 TRINITY_DN23148_c0_g1~~TRINITY_DN23148_c0_g1_i16.p1  ORF type:complete len:316 (-),score=88.54 TRINITY_DN23148_c0_g1_i16:175-1122(-)